MTSANFTSGVYNLSVGEEGKFILTPLTVNKQEFFVPSAQQASSRQFPIIRKPSPHFYTSALGLAGGVGLIVSCVWSVLLPAIGSVGVIAFAYLVNRKITPLHAKELSSENAKAQNLFQQQIARVDSVSLLDEPIDTGHLPPPISPVSNATNSTKAPPPPPPPSAPSMPSKQKEESRKTDSTHTDLNKPGTSGDSRDKLLFSIRNSFNFMQTKELLRGDPEKYPSNLLFKELKATYERALAISESDRFKDWKGYFKSKVDSFDKNFTIEEQIGNQTIEYSDMENICEKASHLDSVLKNMQWIKSLLQVLSERKDLSDEVQNHCSEKSKSIDKHIKKLQRRSEKKSEEAASTQKANSNSTGNDLGVASILARRVAQEPSDSSSSSESESGEEWN
ncbi:MAG: hypothetical protein WBD50_01085 [Candidatus Rhabdochlamydia sp.]